MLDPYRTLGTFISGRISLSASHPQVLTVPTNASFKVYSSALGLKVVSPPLDSPVRAACSHNEYTYVRLQGEVLKLKYHHLVGRWVVPGIGEGSSLLCFEQLILVSEGNELWLIDEQTG
mgnify:CR=1 FL=1